MSAIKIIQGEIFKDDRGQISSLNSLQFDGIKRCYFIHHPDTETIRGWHGHQVEKKWFYCIKGSFTIALVKIDD
jgi:dTDP-4-dehydrorhamnose 3,5-epimerase